MQALVYDDFNAPLTLREVPKPEPAPKGVVLEVLACGVCRSDWHGWKGHDPMIDPPNVPGHEVVGTVTTVGERVGRWSGGERVTVPFVSGCGNCSQCRAGHQQVCPNQFQPGFSGLGAFAELVKIDYADENLVRLPDQISAVTGASLGCRFATAFRAVVDQGEVSSGDWVAVHGCGGVGLSAIMIARAAGAQVVAVDISDAALALAEEIGARHVINGRNTKDVAEAVRQATDGGGYTCHSMPWEVRRPATTQSRICASAAGTCRQVSLLGTTRAPLFPSTAWWPTSWSCWALMAFRHIDTRLSST